MAKSADWETIKYEFNLYRKTKAFKRHAFIAAGTVVLLIAVLVTRWALTSRGPAAAIKKAEAAPRTPVPPQLRGPNDFIESLDSRLRREARFSGRVVAVPSIGADRRSTGGVMIQGLLTSDSDMAALRAMVDQLKPTFPIDWQVVIVEPGR